MTALCTDLRLCVGSYSLAAQATVFCVVWAGIVFALVLIVGYVCSLSSRRFRYGVELLVGGLTHRESRDDSLCVGLERAIPTLGEESGLVLEDGRVRRRSHIQSSPSFCPSRSEHCSKMMGWKRMSCGDDVCLGSLWA